MLHYCAGLQHCIDLEESETQPAAELNYQPSDDSSDSSSESFSMADERSGNL